MNQHAAFLHTPINLQLQSYSSTFFCPPDLATSLFFRRGSSALCNLSGIQTQLVKKSQSYSLRFKKTMASESEISAPEVSEQNGTIAANEEARKKSKLERNEVESNSEAESLALKKQASQAIDFLRIVTRLKEQKRAGWILRNVKDPESIADHMYRMAVMALLAKDQPGIDREKCVKMAIVHDIAEAIVGDITPSDGVSREEKRRREAAAMEELRSALGGGPAAEEMMELWEEYEANASPEAKLVKDFDKVEMILQATEYEQAQGLVLQDFFDSTRGKFQTPLGQAWAAEVVSRREQRNTPTSDAPQEVTES